MDYLTITILLTVAFFSAVQSVFGMGLLVFGTPTLLLLGVSFSEALGWLLPASLAISSIQVAESRRQTRAVWAKGRPLLCLLPMVIALACVLYFNFQARIDLAIGCTMIAASIIRVNHHFQRYLSDVIARTEGAYLVAMGVVHGFTNMGGALLSIYSTATNGDKDGIRGTISAYYVCFGVTQLLLLALFRPGMLGIHSLITALISTTIYVVIGQRLFLDASGIVYEKLVTGFIAAYGLAVLAKATL